MDNSPEDKKMRPVIEPSAIKAFVAGVVVGNINKGLLLGLAIGTVSGIYVQQNYPGVPSVAGYWKILMDRWNKSGGGGSNSGS